jgi:hypothetical protein
VGEACASQLQCGPLLLATAVHSWYTLHACLKLPQCHCRRCTASCHGHVHACLTSICAQAILASGIEPGDFPTLVHEALSFLVEDVGANLTRNDSFFDDVGGAEVWRLLVAVLEVQGAPHMPSDEDGEDDEDEEGVL